MALSRRLYNRFSPDWYGREDTVSLEMRFEGKTYTGPGADEKIVEAMTRLVLECLKERETLQVRVGGWSGVGTRRVMDRVAAAISTDLEGEKGDFSGCVRVVVNPYVASGFSPEYEIRRKVEQLWQFPLSAGNREVDVPFWRKIAIMLKGKPLVAIVENLQHKIDWDVLGIPTTIPDSRGFEKDFMKLVFSEFDEITMQEDRSVEKEFDDLSDEVAIQMLLYEAHSAAMEVKEKYQLMVEEIFVPIQEKVTSMTLPSLAPSAFLHQDNIDNLKGETVIDLLLYWRLSHIPTDQLLDYLRSENSPLSYVDLTENSWKDFLFFTAILRNLTQRRIVQKVYMDEEIGLGKHVIPLHIATKLDALASSSSTTVLRRPLSQVDMAEWNQDLGRISFADNHIKEILLPSRPSVSVNFPNLSTLLLRDNAALQEIPDDIFLYMPNLRVLDLSCTSIKTLPSTLSCLGNLRMLSLEGCKNLQAIDTTGLDNIEVLNLCNCPLYALEKASWCHMRNLKHLRFRRGLCGLQELQLSLKHVYVFDEFSEGLDKKMKNPSNLQKCNIAVLYPNEEDKIRTRSTPDVHFQTSRFPYSKIHADVGKPTGAGVDYDKHLEINGGDGLWSLYTITGIFNPHLLSLSNYQNAQAGIWPDYVPGLEACYIKNCNDMEYVFNSPPIEKWKIMPVVETLWISSLAKLHALYNFRFEQKWRFKNLKSIYVDCCPNLIVLFPSTVCLPSLETVEIRFCSRLGELFPQLTAGESALPRLAKLHLCGLPKLTSICDGGHLPTLRKLEIWGCCNLRKVPVPVPNSDNYPATVVSIRGEEKWWKNVEGVDKDRVDFKVGSVSAAQKHIPCAWKKGVRRHRHPPN